MRVLSCEECNKTITPTDGGIKYNSLYFCSQECLDCYIDWYVEPITEYEFERDGFDQDEEE